MIYKYYFEKLNVWEEMRRLTKIVYQVCESYPPKERYRIVDQIERSVISVSANFAEGSARNTGKDQSHYTTMAFGSLMELLSLIVLSNDLEYMKTEDYEEIRNRISRIARMLNGLNRKQLTDNQ